MLSDFLLGVAVGFAAFMVANTIFPTYLDRLQV